MANITQFIENESYRRDILKQVAIKLDKIEKKNSKEEDVFKKDPIVKIYKKFKPNDDSEDLYGERCGDDFGIEEIHRYEEDIVEALKIFGKKYPHEINKPITKIYFSSIIKDDEIQMGNTYPKMWLYIINVKMLIDNSVLDYHNISHNLSHDDTYFENEQYILAYDNELLCNCSEDEFFEDRNKQRNKYAAFDTSEQSESD